MEKKNILLGCCSLVELLDLDADAVLWINDYYRNKSKQLRIYKDGVEQLVLPKFWQTQEEFCDAKDYSIKVYKTVIVELARQLDEMHHSCFGERGWNILLGDWLRFYIEGFYDKYVRVKYAAEYYPRLYMKKSSRWYIPRGESLPNNEILQEQVYRDVYNFLYSDSVAANMDEHYEVMQDVMVETKGDNEQHGIRRGAVQGIQRLLCNKDISLYFNTPYLPLSRTTLELLSRGRIRRLVLPNMESPANNISMDRRRMLKREADYGDEFINLIHDCLWRHIPMECVEDFQDYYKVYRMSNLKVAAKILDSITVHSNFLFKIFVVDALRHGGKLEIIQHGGNYCIEKYRDLWEFVIADKYFTWGDGFIKNKPGNMYAMPVPKTLSIKKGKKRSVLFVGYTYPPYVAMFRNLYTMKIEKLYKEEDLFFQELQPTCKEILRVRCYPVDPWWERKESLGQKFPWMQFDSNASYYDSMSKAKLVVTHIISTTCMESINCDIPTIIICSKEFFIPDENAVEILNELRRVQVLFDDPKNAAELINNNVQNIDAWWNETERKAVVGRFRKMYASRARFSKWIWTREILRESKNF